MDTLEIVSITAFILSQAADVWTTARAINSGCGREANPFMSWMIAKLGLYPGLIIPKLVVIGIIFVATILCPAVMPWVVLALSVGYFVIAYRNYGIVGLG